jgi:glutamyl-tRNA reductase
VGLNHQTAPVELRERFYLADEALQSVLQTLRDNGLAEVVVVSTCNRLEILGWVEQVGRGFEVIGEYLARSQNASVEHLRAYVYFLEGRDVVQHVMGVASGLESLILWERQVMGQVAHALAQAQTAGTCGVMLSRLFTSALHAGKRARTETSISRHTLSVSHAAVLLLKQHIEHLSSVQVLVIGVGEMAELAARALQMHGATSIGIINRTDARADTLARRLGVQALKWDNLSKALQDFDVAIAATSAPGFVIRARDIEGRVGEPRKYPILFVDIAVPRNIDPRVGELPGVKLYDLDDLQAVVETHRNHRQAEVGQVKAIIDDELETYWQWLHTRQVVPLITELRRQAETLAQTELEETLRRLPGLNPQEQAIVAQLAHRIANKLLHAPTVSLKSRAAYDTHYDYVHAVRQLFALEEAEDMEHMNAE